MLFSTGLLKSAYGNQVEKEIEALLARQNTLQAQREQLLRQISVDKRAPKADWQVGAIQRRTLQACLLEKP